MKMILFILLFIIPFIGYTQDFSEGYEYLNNGQFEKARDYFEDKIQSYPENLTANICYLRALGLSSDPVQANALFTILKNENPGNDEVKMNWIESMMWNKKYYEAASQYDSMVRNGTANFAVYLNYANCLSNLHKFPKAIEMIKKAMVLEPNNSSALNSRKYIYLAYSYDCVINQNFQLGNLIMDSLRIWYPDDEKVYFSWANNKLIEKNYAKAITIYSNGLKNNMSPSQCYFGLALAYSGKGNAVKSVKYFEKKLSLNNNTANDSVTYVNLLLGNAEVKKANTILQLMSKSTNLDSINYYNTLSRLLQVFHKYQDAENAINQALQINALDQQSNLSFINNAYKQHNAIDGLNTIDLTSHYYVSNYDIRATNFLYLNKFNPYIGGSFSYAFDSDSSYSQLYRANLMLPISGKFYINPFYFKKSTENRRIHQSGHTTTMGLEAIYSPNEDLILSFSGSKINLINAESMKSSHFQYKTQLTWIPTRYEYLNIGIEKEYQNFNIQLINQNLSYQNIFVNNNLNYRNRIGLFTQAYYTTLSDGNVRKILYNSLYATLKKSPAIKVGINYQLMNFKENKQLEYFSPQKFVLTEGFLEVFKDADVYGKAFYRFVLAIGQQNINNESAQSTYRYEAELGLKTKNANRLSVFTLKTNAANSTAAGFIYTEYGVKIRIYLSKEPLFKGNSKSELFF